VKVFPDGTEEEVIPPGYEAQWVIACSKNGLRRLNVTIPDLDRQTFKHAPTPQEIAERMKSNAEKIGQEITSGDLKIEHRREQVRSPSLPHRKAGH
jgi:hypothetical protein